MKRDLKQAILDAVYCAYHASVPDKRPEALYDMIVNAKDDAITLEAIMQHGNEELPKSGMGKDIAGG